MSDFLCFSDLYPFPGTTLKASYREIHFSKKRAPFFPLREAFFIKREVFSVKGLGHAPGANPSTVYGRCRLRSRRASVPCAMLSLWVQAADSSGG